VTIESFTDERVLTEDVQELMKKIEIRVDSSLPKNPDLRHHPVAIRLRDGKEGAGAQLLACGHWRYPLERADWLGKFRDNAARIFAAANVEKIIALIDDLENLDDVCTLTEALRP
jgi:2-methylcitrate dehydratase PrpD